MKIHIIGTSHIAVQSVDEIKKYIETEKPDVVAVELDVQRAAALFSQTKNRISLQHITQIGVKGFLFAKLGQYAQQKLGKMTGVVPGSDMKAAIEIARQHKVEIALIDRPIGITLQRISKYLTWKERWRFVVDLVKGLFMPKRQMKQFGMDTFDLRTVPEKELIKKMMGLLEKRYPSLYKVLVEERNRYMVKKLVELMRKFPEKKILAVVGAGHKEGMEKLLLKVEVVR